MKSISDKIEIPEKDTKAILNLWCSLFQYWSNNKQLKGKTAQKPMAPKRGASISGCTFWPTSATLPPPPPGITSGQASSERNGGAYFGLHQLIKNCCSSSSKKTNFPLAAWRAAEELTQKRTQGRSKHIQVTTAPPPPPPLEDWTWFKSCAHPTEVTAGKHKAANKQPVLPSRRRRSGRAARGRPLQQRQRPSFSRSEAFFCYTAAATLSYCVFITSSSASPTILLWTAGPCASVSGGQTAPGSESQPSGSSTKKKEIRSRLADEKWNWNWMKLLVSFRIWARWLFFHKETAAVRVCVGRGRDARLNKRRWPCTVNMSLHSASEVRVMTHPQANEALRLRPWHHNHPPGPTTLSSSSGVSVTTLSLRSWAARGKEWLIHHPIGDLSVCRQRLQPQHSALSNSCHCQIQFQSYFLFGKIAQIHLNNCTCNNFLLH